MRLAQYTACFAGLAGSALSAAVSMAACTNKVIDNFSQFANRTNSLGSVSGDDKSMTTISASGTTLSFNPKAGAYFYENFPCENAAGDGYSALSFTLSGPAQASLLIEIQTKANCAATAVTRSYHNVTVPTTASTVSVPLASFEGANLEAITSFAWSTFNKTGAAYTLGNIQLVCK